MDRYGQPRSKVRVLTYYGIDNQIDGIVLDVLIKKHKSIRTSLGISVPVPVDSEKVIEAIIEGLLLRGKSNFDRNQLQLFDEDVLEPVRRQFHRDWESVAEREKRSQTMVAQATIKVDEVARELAEVQAAIGSGADVARFAQEALTAHNAVVAPKPNGVMAIDLTHTPEAVRDALTIPAENIMHPSASGDHSDQGNLIRARHDPILGGEGLVDGEAARRQQRGQARFGDGDGGAELGAGRVGGRETHADLPGAGLGRQLVEQEHGQLGRTHGRQLIGIVARIHLTNCGPVCGQGHGEGVVVIEQAMQRQLARGHSLVDDIPEAGVVQREQRLPAVAFEGDGDGIVRTKREQFADPSGLQAGQVAGDNREPAGCGAIVERGQKATQWPVAGIEVGDRS